MLPSINTRKKLVILSDDREIAITEQQYNAIKAEQSIWKYTDPIVITDADTKKVLFDWKLWAIKEFRDINTENRFWDRFICDFWTRHPLSDECNCQDKYKVYPIQFTQRMYKMFPWMYASKLSESQKMSIIQSLSN